MIYAIKNTRTGSFKIGFSRQPEVRVKGLQTGHEDELSLVGCTFGDLAFEARVHKHLTAAGEHLRGEWFKGPATEAMAVWLQLLQGIETEEGCKAARRAIMGVLAAPESARLALANYIKEMPEEADKAQVAQDIERIMGWGAKWQI